jgi:hypothetical protein
MAVAGKMKIMDTKNFSTTFLVDQGPHEVYKAINDPRAWWGKGIEGNTRETGDEFVYRHKEFHYSKQKLVEMIPDKKVVWLVTDSALSFVAHQDEWTGTQISFDISQKGKKTQVVFTHHGLTPRLECFKDCSGNGGWGHYIGKSLLALITTGKGQPDPKEYMIAS